MPDVEQKLKVYLETSFVNYLTERSTLMLYRYDEQADIIHIIRFFHELQDYANILLGS